MITTEKLKEITELAESVPEPFRLKCFELLLSHHLSAQETKHDTKVTPKGETKTEFPKHTFVLPIDVKAFLNQYSIDEAVLSKLYFIEGNNVRPIYNLKAHKKAAAQIQHALLMSLENALINGEFRFNIEALRQRCKDLKCFDAANFMAILKKNSSLFKDLDDEEAVFLSTDGKAELANVIEELVNE
jgi:hypothetical protein